LWLHSCQQGFVMEGAVMRISIPVVLAGIAGLSGAASAQCDTATLEELVFLSGDWNRYEQTGIYGGQSYYVLDADACEVVEMVEGDDGNTLQRALFVDPDTGQWRETYNPDFFYYDLSGEIDANGALVMTGWSDSGEEGSVREDLRARWAPLDDGAFAYVMQVRAPGAGRWDILGAWTYVPRGSDPNGETPAPDAQGPALGSEWFE
jgi:hypothetical protein